MRATGGKAQFVEELEGLNMLHVIPSLHEHDNQPQLSSLTTFYLQHNFIEEFFC
jgi:hypothetical protein